MHPKRVVLVAASASGSSADEAALQQLRAALQPLEFAQAFSNEQTMAFARQLWAGRDKAPYFLKVRSRPALDACSSGGGAASAAAASVWAELLQQNWRVQLDAGLGSAAPESEALLLVCTPEAVQQLMAAAGAAPSGGSGSSSELAVSLLEVDGTQAGAPLDWQQLSKRLTLDGVAPSAGDAIAAALSQAGVAA
ncbi:phospho-2-dehydro-3-deoxyheptonate aldolase [Chlorella sorokiniana]|uniref:Phospho-2-dehydro-3-deoxyheptonate aldolase n=1 Tax=Chlorella sorokiniana TaxID=3076 RepID=A0A2P6U0H7_CHLSO|nr:phospho-2-dehydro-3-deoxyheptonate aldolase [Chlorella sorokiniana]|eukprot:PRW59817.1 phospho-2-dehydro-3-deoxyheptonate aldolase [Chlorella sorokiniana]